MKHWTVIAAAALMVACGNSNNASNNASSTNGDTPDAGGMEDTGTDVSPGADASTQPDADGGGASCEPVFLGPDDEPFETLSEYCLFGGDTVAHEPSEGVIPFEPIAVLYADKSLKDRFIAVPPGKQISFDAMDRWIFPEGTVLVKTFYFWNDATNPSQGRQLLETRLLVKQSGEWESYIYIWDGDQTEATFIRIGDWIELDRVDDAGASVTTTYRVPNQNQCKSCHEQSDAVVPLGPRAFQLNSELDYGGELGTKNQLEHWAELNLFDGSLPATSEVFALTDYIDDSADIDARARSYLEVNCAHCHSPDGAADPSGLKLSVTVTEPAEFGVCRTPVAAGGGSGGLFYDIVPGMPDESILVYRMSSTDPEIKMPELPTQTADDFGVQLMREWIGQMEPAGCPDP